MKLQDYSGQAFLQHLEEKDEALIQWVNELDDFEVKNIIYEVAQIVAKFVMDEDENILHSIDFLEDKIDKLTTQIQKESKTNGIWSTTYNKWFRNSLHYTVGI